MGDPITTGLAIGAGNSLLSGIASAVSQGRNRSDLDYQMSRYYSPTAQVNNLAAAGLNPAVAMGNQSPVFSSGGQLGNNPIPNFSVGVESLTDLGNYIKSMSDAKKSGADTDKAIAETDAIKFQNDLQKQFGAQKWVTDLALAYQNVLLAQKTNDAKEQEIAINEFKKVSESALATANEYQRDILKKRLENTDTELRLANKLQEEKAKTEKSAQSANYASANASNTQADVNRQVRRLQSALADIEEGGKTEKIKSLIAEYKKNQSISDADAKEAEVKLSRLESIQDKRSSSFFREVDNYLEWLKDKVRIFH